jgi:hypothetical protein
MNNEDKINKTKDNYTCCNHTFIEDHIELGNNYDFPIIKKIVYCIHCEYISN